MVDLIGKKIWIGNDRELLRKIEEYAFAQGWGYPKNNGNYLGNGVYKIYTYPKHTQVKKVYSLCFLISKYENKKVIVINMCNPKKNCVISKYYTHKNRFDDVVEWDGHYHHHKINITEIKLTDIFKTIEVW